MTGKATKTVLPAQMDHQGRPVVPYIQDRMRVGMADVTMRLEDAPRFLYTTHDVEESSQKPLRLLSEFAFLYARQLGDFNRVRQIGVGASATVWEIKLADVKEMPIVVKYVQNEGSTPALRTCFVREAVVYGVLDGLNVSATMIAIVVSQPPQTITTTAQLYQCIRGLVIEKMTGAITAYECNLSPSEMRASVFNAVEVMRANGLAHNDVKSCNTLYDEQTKHAVLCDFGMTTKEGEPDKYGGTIAYAAPERLLAGARLLRPNMTPAEEAQELRARQILTDNWTRMNHPKAVQMVQLFNRFAVHWEIGDESSRTSSASDTFAAGILCVEYNMFCILRSKQQITIPQQLRPIFPTLMIPFSVIREADNIPDPTCLSWPSVMSQLLPLVHFTQLPSECTLDDFDRNPWLKDFLYIARQMLSIAHTGEFPEHLRTGETTMEADVDRLQNYGKLRAHWEIILQQNLDKDPWKRIPDLAEHRSRVGEFRLYYAEMRYLIRAALPILDRERRPAGEIARMVV